MKKFKEITSLAIPMPISNIDTDMIIPGKFLKTVKRTGLSKGLFYRMRFNEDGSKNKSFVLNKEIYCGAKIIVAGENFGCGSSREHAPWALIDYGISCIISTSFADIFFNNANKNGILCVIVKNDELELLMDKAEIAEPININLIDQKITNESKEINIIFNIEKHRKNNLINGLDEIGITLENNKKITDYENKLSISMPWL
ncbi:3-isopropylmalate dehydratase small subunit [Alphaproteobacteria bacterium]|nr:3-isopropylmalate dehydratase small subunit [Alphaproteobacteria bacterium]